MARHCSYKHATSALTDDNLAQPCRGRGSWTSCRPRGSPSHRAIADPRTALPKQPLRPSWKLQMPKCLQIRCVGTLDIPVHTSAVDIAAQNLHGMHVVCMQRWPHTYKQVSLNLPVVNGYMLLMKCVSHRVVTQGPEGKAATSQHL